MVDPNDTPPLDLLPGPAVLRHEEVVEERQPVERDADDREEREEGRFLTCGMKLTGHFKGDHASE